MDYVYRRVLSIHFRLVEKCLRDITSTLEVNTTDRHYILYSINNNADSETRKSIFRISVLMLEQIQKMKEEFTLESDEELAVKRDVLSNLSEIWAPIKDLAARRMHGYDRLSNRDKELLNPHIMKLYAMLEEIYKEMK
ncbi:MAG: hypothetical protein WBF33_24520 [Candidatus Nitrosopolaris sp.]|jgi:hypothetical protein